MSNASVSFDSIKNELMEDKEFRKEYDKLKAQYEKCMVDDSFRGAIYIIKDEEVICKYV